MKKEQKNIYYISGESVEAVENSPFLEKLKKKDLEVLYLVDPIDEYAIQHVTEYDGKKLQSVSKEGLSFGDSDDKTEKKRLELYKVRRSELCAGLHTPHTPNSLWHVPSFVVRALAYFVSRSSTLTFLEHRRRRTSPTRTT